MAVTESRSRGEPVRPGDVVVDTDDESPSEAIVVKTPNAVASSWRVPGGTVADTNPDYPDDDPVAVVVFRDALEAEYPLYTGGMALALSQLGRDGLDYYAFPDARLRRVDRLEARELALDEINPSPYHARNFCLDGNRAYVAEIRERGKPDPIPLVRDCGGRFEVLNGHKRIWASYVAGLESIPCDVHYSRDLYAARMWARYHLHGYAPEERSIALQRIESHLDSQQAEYISDRILPDDATVSDDAEFASAETDG